MNSFLVSELLCNLLIISVCYNYVYYNYVSTRCKLYAILRIYFIYIELFLGSIPAHNTHETDPMLG